ncbi:MAG TPA: hypothetical protein VGQ09_01925 [Chitinophagaceae bacterium]|nr:hypothetical protein [Chitinophagaceae bacterium]
MFTFLRLKTPIAFSLSIIQDTTKDIATATSEYYSTMVLQYKFVMWLALKEFYLREVS